MISPREYSDLCVFEYRYRDAGNFKTPGSLLLIGNASEAGAILRLCLDWGDQFVAEQVGIPSLSRQHWASVSDQPSELDHAFHEFVCLRTATDRDLGLPAGGQLQTLLAKMQAAAGRWDVRLSPNYEL